MQYSNTLISVLIDEYIHSETDRAIMKRRLVDNIPLETLAAEYHYSDRHMRRKCKAMSRELFAMLPPCPLHVPSASSCPSCFWRTIKPSGGDQNVD